MAIESITVGSKPEQECYLVWAHRWGLCEKRVKKWILSSKESDLIVKKENKLCLPLSIRGHKKQVFWHCLLQSNKPFGTVYYKVTSLLILFATK